MNEANIIWKAEVLDNLKILRLAPLGFLDAIKTSLKIVDGVCLAVDIGSFDGLIQLQTFDDRSL